MKFTFCMVGCLAVVLGHVRADPEPVTPDSRKARHPVNGPTNYNSISVPDSETLSKLQNQVAPSVQQIPLKPIGLPTKSEAGSVYSVTPSPLGNIHVPTTANQNLAGQYYMAMATPHSTGNQVLAPAASPLIMQYINPQGQPTGGLQYIQLLRPVMYNPYGTQYVQPSYVQQQPTVGINQHQHAHPSHSLAHYSHAGPVAPPSPTSTPTATTQSSFVPFQPSSLQQAQYGTVASPSHHHHGHLAAAAAPVATYSNPIGQYSSPMLSYFSPPRISLINGPGELNTNEYMPNPGDHVFIKGVKTIRA